MELSEKNKGFIICTGFINRKMPLIRYKVDDYAERYYDLYKIEGHREQEVLIGKNDERISAAMINFHSDVMRCVVAYQFAQSKKGIARLRIVLTDKNDVETAGQIKSAVEEKIGPALEIEIEVVDKIQLSGRGKYRLIVKE